MPARNKDKYKERYASRFGNDRRDHGNPYGRGTEDPDYARRGETGTYHHIFDSEKGGMPFRGGPTTRYPSPYGPDSAREDSYESEPSRRPGLEYRDGIGDDDRELYEYSGLPESAAYEGHDLPPTAREPGPRYGYSVINVPRPVPAPAPARGRGPHRGHGPKGYRRSDARIEEDINEMLTVHPDINATDVEVEIKDGVVTLAGWVENRHMKRLAEDETERISGVREVLNHIRVRSHG